jgi:hypothetical protein
MEQQIKNLLEKFEQRILAHLKKGCPIFSWMEPYDDKTIYEPSKTILHMKNIIRVIFSEIYSCMRDYVEIETHGISLDKMYVYVDHTREKMSSSCELSVGRGIYFLAQGDSNTIDKLRKLIEVLISDIELRDTIIECYRLLKQLTKVGRENEIYQLNYIEWLPITFIKDVKYSAQDRLNNRIAGHNKS